MPRKVLALLFLFASMVSFCGCWDAHDIEQLSFPYVSAFDLHKGSSSDADLRETPVVDVSLLNPNLSPNAQDKAEIKTVAVPLVAYARDNFIYTLQGSFYPGINQVLLIGEDLARQGIKTHLDLFFRVAVFSASMNLAVVEGRGEAILRTKETGSDTMGTKLRALLRKSNQKGFVPATTLHEFGSNVAPGKNPIVPLIKKQGPDKVIISGSALFNKDRMVYKLNNKDTRSLVILRSIKSMGLCPFFLEEDGAKLAGGALQIQSTRKVTVLRNGDHYTFHIKIKLDGDILEYFDGKHIDEAQLKAIENKVSADFTRDFRRFIGMMQQDIKLDCIDISKYAQAKWRKDLKTSIDTPAFIENANIQVQVEVTLHTMGELQ